MESALYRAGAAIHGQDGARHLARFIGRQIERHRRHVLGLARAQGRLHPDWIVVAQQRTHAFGGLAAGALSDGVNFSTISASYTGVNPGTNAAHDAGNASFVFSTADQTLYFDPDGASAGYSVIALVQTGASVAASDIEIIAA